MGKWFTLVLLLVLLLWTPVNGVYFDTPVQKNLKAARMQQRKVDSECTKKCKEDSRGLELTACIQDCSSPYCYNIVINQELEEGEIDTRETRFKNCLLEDIKRRKRKSDE